MARGRDEVARVVEGGPQGPSDVLADPIRGKPYIEVRLDRERAAQAGGAGRQRQRADRDGDGRADRDPDGGRGRGEGHPVVVRVLPTEAVREDGELETPGTS